MFSFFELLLVIICILSKRYMCLCAFLKAAGYLGFIIPIYLLRIWLFLAIYDIFFLIFLIDLY